MYWRKYLLVTEAQMELVLRQWDCIEEELNQASKQKIQNLKKKEEILANALNYKGRIRPVKYANQGVMLNCRMNSSDKMPPVPDETRNQIPKVPE